jgi:hypothetical protein
MARRSDGRLGVLVAMGALVASMIAIWFALRREPGKQAGSETSVAQTPEAPASGPDQNGPRAPGCHFAKGQRLAYTIDVQTRVQVHPDRLNLPAGARIDGPTDRSSQAHLDLKVLSAEAAGGAVLLARYGFVDTRTVAEAGALDGPFLLKVSNRCKIEGYARLDSTGTDSARTQQALAHELQWYWPETGQGIDEGETAFGRYQAAYKVDGATVDRTIESYGPIWARGGNLGKPMAQASTGKPAISTMKVSVGTGPWFASLTSRERLVGLALVDTDTTTKVASRAPTTGVLDGVPVDPKRYVWENMFTRPVARATRPVPRSREHLAAVEKMKQVELPAALDLMYQAINKDLNIAHVWPVMGAYLEAHPDDAQEVVDRLKKGAIADGAVAATFIALGKTPTTQARDALWGLKDDRQAATILRAQSAFALVDRADVGVTLARSLLQDSQNLSKGATRNERLFSREAALALGMMAGLKADDGEVKQVASQGALDLLKAGRNATTLRPAIGALANIGDPALLPHVMPHIRSADPKVREAATTVIRRMPPAETASLTVDWLAREDDPFVKRRLYRTLSHQLFDAQQAPDPRIVDRAIADLARSSSVATRQSIIHILGAIAPSHPQAREALVRQVKRESNEESGLLKVLGQYLAAPDIARGLEM